MSVYEIFKEKWFNQSVWLYSDPHFSEATVNYPTDEEQIKNINSCVGRKDTLIILGDVGNVECVKQLRGYKVLIMGNHDTGASNYKKQIHSEIFSKEHRTHSQEIHTDHGFPPGKRILNIGGLRYACI